MDMSRISLAICVLGCCAVAATMCWSQPDEWPVLEGPYLGQMPPGDDPVVFAPGIISTSAPEGATSVSPDGSFLLFARARAEPDGILITEQIDGVWSKPHRVSFSEGRHDWDFTLAPDGKTVLVASARPDAAGEEPLDDHRIWISTRNGREWSEPRVLAPPVNAGQHDSYPWLSAAHTLYFFSGRDGGLGHGDIYRATGWDGNSPRVENLGAPVNGPHHEVDPYIAPDESFLIFCSDRPGGFGKADIYVSFRTVGEGWSEPINLGDRVNTAADEYIPSVTPDGRYFLFTSNVSGNREIYWMDSGLIEELRPE